jgi:hypothetical protein
VAYKAGCPEVCVSIINNMYGYNAMEVQEAFVKIKEQAQAYLDMPHEATAGARWPGADGWGVAGRGVAGAGLVVVLRLRWCNASAAEHTGSPAHCARWRPSSWHTPTTHSHHHHLSAAGLNLLNTTNLDYFQAGHQSELFRLKGLFLQQLDDSDAAHMAFSTALMLHRCAAWRWLGCAAPAVSPARAGAGGGCSRTSACGGLHPP